MSAPFTVPPGAEVVIEVLSPNAGDDDVDVTAYLYDAVPVDSTLVDAAISTRSTVSAGDQMDLVDAPNATALIAIATAAWDRLTSALTAVGSIGRLLVDNVDATISGRSSHSANDARDAILSDATRFAGANVDAAITSRAATGEAATAVGTLNNLSAAEVRAEMVAALSTDTFAELAAVPGATATLADKLTWLFMLARNRVTQTAAVQTLYADDEATLVGTARVSDDSITFDKEEYS